MEDTAYINLVCQEKLVDEDAKKSFAIAMASVNLMVPLSAKKLPNARLAWINTAWFLERGIDVTKLTIRKAVGKFLLDRFAYDAISMGDQSQCKAPIETFYADRYGGTGLVPHGGSGRAASRHGVQVKGIGRTPLVGLDANEQHSHGCLWLDEALREAVVSEVFAQELPHGAIRSIAVIDAGQKSYDPLSGQHERRGLLLRPFSLRIAHLQRATAFIPAFGQDNQRVDDAMRTRDFVRRYLAEIEHEERLFARPEELVRSVAEQIAICRLYRLHHGGFFSSNICLDGRLIDFGAARSVDNWSKQSFEYGAPAFGDEISTFIEVIRSLSFYLRKYAETNTIVPTPDTMIRTLCECFLNCANLESYSSAGEPVLARQLYFHALEGVGVKEIEGRDTVMGLDSWNPSEIRDASQSLRPTYARLIGNRPLLDRERLVDHLKRQTADERAGHNLRSAVVSLEQRIHTTCRRRWPLLGDADILQSQISDGVTSALVILNQQGDKELLLSSICIDQKVVLFGHWIDIAHLIFYEVAKDGAYRTFRLPSEMFSEARGLLTMPKFELARGAALYVYS